MATIIRVPADYATIQGGVDASSPRDTVLVGPGSYTESVVIQQPLTLVSEDGPASTVIEADGADAGVKIIEDADNSVLEGFTIRGGATRGGVYAGSTANVTIRGNLVEENSWGGIRVSFTQDVLLEGNTIRSNFGGKGYSALDVYDTGTATIRGNRIEENFGGYYLAWLEGYYAIVEDNVVVNNNDTGAFVCYLPSAIRNNTFAGNGNSIALAVAGVASIRGNIFEHASGLALGCAGIEPDSASCNIFWGGADPVHDDCGITLGTNGNQFADPLFCDEENGDYTLQAHSPAANGPCGIIGALPVGCGSTGVGVPSAVGAARQLVAYPNPARSRVQIQLRSGALDLAAGSAPVDVFGASGRLITTLSLDGGGVEWNVRGVPAGVYWLRVSENPELPPLRLVLTR